jgi:hypothetical protein
MQILNNGSKCPKATINIEENLRNRLRAIEVAKYGPANPMLPNVPFWDRLSKLWSISVPEAKTMRCGNCGFFDIKPKTLDCIAKGIGSDGVDAYDSIRGSSLGYCRAFHFKCAAARTCDAWVSGGPLR